MMLIVCSVFDAAVHLYGRPICFRARGEAVRSFTDEVNRKGADNQLNAHPEDFELHLLAQFEEESGSFVQQPSVHEVLVRGKDVYHDA